MTTNDEWTHPKCEDCDELMMLDSSKPYCQSCEDIHCLRMKEMEQYDRYILWTMGNDNKITIHHANYYGNEMLEDMYEIIMAGVIDGVYISAVEGGDNCSDQIKMWENRDEHICYSWTIKDGANEEFKEMLDGRQDGLW